MGLFEKLVNDTGVKIKFDEPMKSHTSIGVGGNAAYYMEADSLYLLKETMTAARRGKIPFRIIGNGTNLLFSDSGYDGLVINIKPLSDVFFKADDVRAMAGANLGKLIDFSVKNRLTGLERLADIPATVGGAIVMNAGAFGGNISDRVLSVQTIKDGKLCYYAKNECRFGYRTSRFKGKKEVVVSADFRLEPCEREMVLAGLKTYAEERRKMQPHGRSCGSVFKNPPEESAGRLIEKAGLKGFSLGGATVSEKHANFILNEKNACAADVYELIQHVKQRVKDLFGVMLAEEVEYIGEF